MCQLVLNTLKYFLPEKDFSWDELERITAKPRGKWTWPVAAMLWLVENGFEIKDIETFDYGRFVQEREKYLLETYGEEVAAAQIRNSDIEQERDLSAEFIKKISYSQSMPGENDLKSLLEQGFLCICAIDSGSLAGESEYSSHSVVLKGYTNDAFILHDPDVPPVENREVPFNKFEQAWAYPNAAAKNVLAVRMKQS
ncbi:MAG: hypothetical protein WAN50_02295 [Minisyncoccia bacterium]